MKRLAAHVAKMIKKHPQLRIDIYSFFSKVYVEIRLNNGILEDEIAICYDSINDLIDNQERQA